MELGKDFEPQQTLMEEYRTFTDLLAHIARVYNQSLFFLLYFLII